MPTTMASFCREKAVLVTLYVERPRRHHHHHHHLHQRSTQRGACKGYSRRAELLQHSRNLRESASPLQPLILRNTVDVVSSERKVKNRKSDPSCVGNLRGLSLSFLRSLGTLRAKKSKREKKQGRNNATDHVKSIQGQKKRGLFAMVLSKFYKQR